MLAALLLVLGVAVAQEPPGAPPPDGLQLSQGAWTLTARPSVGAQWLAGVGDGARRPLGDPATTETVRLAQTAVGLDLRGPGGVFASLRGEEGLLQGDPDAFEAWVGAAAAGGRLGAWVGQNDLPVTRDRDRENDGLALSWRPALSARAFPLHPRGAGVGAAWPGRMKARGGVAYDDLGVDRPLWWARVDLHPMGPPPDRQNRSVDGFRALIGGGLARLDSAIVGRTELSTVDLELRLGPIELSGAWVHLVEAAPGGPEAARSEWILETGSPLARFQTSDLHLHLRAERLRGMAPGLAAQWVPTGRLAWLAGQGALEAYTEARLSFEVPAAGTSAAEVQRENHVVGVGMLARW